MPTALRTAACSEYHAGVLERHLPAAELGELRTESSVPIMGRADCFRDMTASYRSDTALRLGQAGLAWPIVTTYTLRKGSREDCEPTLVVIGDPRAC